MRLTSYIFPLCFLATITNAHAECYGDAADQYGCGNSMATPGRSDGTLERFGASSDAPIIIDNGGSYSRNQNYYDVFSPEEERRMLRSTIISAGNRSMSSGYGNRSYGSNARALRTFRGHRISGRGFR